MINKIFNKTYGKYERKTYIESEIDNFLEKYRDKNISISYDNSNKFNTEEITKSLRKKLRNKLIGVKEFKEEYDKFIDNIVKFEYFKSTKKKVVFLQTKDMQEIQKILLIFIILN